jgi:hypothetical protein
MIKSIEGIPEGTVTEKRVYLPGVKILWVCKSCGEEHIKDLENNYLSYPEMNIPFGHTLYCCECSEEEEVNILLKVSLELV